MSIILDIMKVICYNGRELILKEFEVST